MKTVIAIFKPFRLEAVLDALKPVTTRRVNFIEVRGYGRQKGHLDAYVGEWEMEFIPKIRLEVEIDDLFLEEGLRVIREAARTGRIGDGKIFVFSQLELSEHSPGRSGGGSPGPSAKDAS